MKKNYSLEQLCDIRFGVYAQPSAEGTVAYLQVRQFDEDGQLILTAADYINLDEKSHYNLLRKGDILFVAKGSKLFAWCFEEELGPAVASSAFFVLRPQSQQILPEYLVAILNADQNRAFFRQLSEGSNIFSIRKPALAAFEVPVHPLSKQRSLSVMAATHQHWLNLNKLLVAQKQNLYQAIISKSLK